MLGALQGTDELYLVVKIYIQNISDLACISDAQFIRLDTRI